MKVQYMFPENNFTVAGENTMLTALYITAAFSYWGQRRHAVSNFNNRQFLLCTVYSNIVHALPLLLNSATHLMMES